MGRTAWPGGGNRGRVPRPAGGAEGYPGDLETVIAQGTLRAAGEALAQGNRIDLDRVDYLPPLRNPPKVVCVGLNFHDHSAESGFKQPDYPTILGRFNSSLIGHGAPIVRPRLSEQLDYEGELVAVIGTGGRGIPQSRALEHVAGYSIFNDASIRDYQFKSPQWTMGKNFDDTVPRIGGDEPLAVASPCSGQACSPHTRG